MQIPMVAGVARPANVLRIFRAVGTLGVCLVNTTDLSTIVTSHIGDSCTAYGRIAQ